MGLRMRKSFRLAKGVRLNIGKKSTSISVGNKYGHTTISTGSSRRSRSSGHLKNDIVEMVRNQGNVSEKQQTSNLSFMKVCCVIMTIVGTLAVLIAFVAFDTAGAAGIMFVVIPLFCYFLAWMFNPV
jgi:hypothetical protein